ncbi:MAG: thioredoxin domain-containing protein [Patescibacteria group bacterium]
MNNIKVFFLVIGILVLGVIATIVFRANNNVTTTPGQYDTFTQCLKDKGAIFYGAFWCPHCQAQKKLFGSSAKFLPYVECSTLDGKAQLPECTEKNITGYPTWEFADGSRMSGEVPLADLAAKTACELPQ